MSGQRRRRCKASGAEATSRAGRAGWAGRLPHASRAGLLRAFGLAAGLGLGACGGDTPNDATAARHFAQGTGGKAEAARLFQDRCAGCHGATGTGDGPLAPQLSVAPPDLTGIRSRAGGTFPSDRIMAQIYGYPGRHHLNLMPEFGAELSGPLVAWRTQDGEDVPTPRGLIELVAYLEGLQS